MSVRQKGKFYCVILLMQYDISPHTVQYHFTDIIEIAILRFFHISPYTVVLFIKIALEDIELFLDCGGELVAELGVELLDAGNFVLPKVFVNVEN